MYTHCLVRTVRVKKKRVQSSSTVVQCIRVIVAVKLLYSTDTFFLTRTAHVSVHTHTHTHTLAC